METGILLIVFAAGLIAGFLLAKISNKSIEDTQVLKRKLEELREEHQGYQESVNEHFTHTADLIDKMNKNYNEIQSHLMQGAELLVNSEYRLEVNGSELDEEHNMEQGVPEAAAPRDYAPKEPDQEGTLSESYGLKAEDLQTEKKE